MRKSRILLVLLCLVFAVSVLAGCGSKESGTTQTPSGGNQTTTSGNQGKSDEKIEMTFMGWGQPSEQEIFQKMFNKFQDKNANITVKYINVDPGQFATKLSTAIAGGTAPDVFYVTGGDFMKYVKSNTLLNLSPYLDSASVFDKNDVWPQALIRWSSDGQISGKGDLYALPKDVGPYPMVYNKTLMEECGVTPPDPKVPWTWEQFLDACAKMTKDKDGDGKIDQFGCAFIPNEAAIWSMGGSWLSEDKTRVTIDTPEFVKGLKLLYDITNTYHYAPNANENSANSWWNRWLAGEIGITGMGPWDQPTFWTQLEFEWDIAQWPMDKDTGISRNWLGSMGIGVYAKTKYQQQAFDLASYLTLDPDGQRELYQMGQMVPNLISMARGEFLEMDKGPKSRFVFLDYIEKYSAPDIGSGNVDNKWLDQFNQDLAEVMNGKMSPEEWVKKEQPILQKLYEEGGNVPSN
ncbi:MAG TPA: sugar ABC transporter substrate-binding protein [Clostridiaceae bacterium]|nr:sugar ABC transporter substrate-binding protein [Clostridiaceae bacterium]